MSTDALVDFIVKLEPGVLSELCLNHNEHCNMLEKTFKLFTTKSTRNMYLFDKDQRLRKYDSANDIIDEYYDVRYNGYVMRKEYMIKSLEREVMILSNKARFIKEQCDDIIDLRKKKKAVVIELLKTRNYDVVDGDEEYKYLTKMPIDSVLEENVEKLQRKRC